ncbi:MAG: AmmeMemoRadiSam system radical SAM enzyme [Candidatus Pacebacteria bacterium]|nr:AmmeMemoRadiSam system radical SAM enzyme [Candidatus Paceibacterota bacterium]
MLKYIKGMKECLAYKKLSEGRVQCRACNHYCVIANNSTGKCGVRKNQNHALFSLTYGRPCAIAVDPIEKKPLYHFLPGTKTLSLAALGCNFKCQACQNWQISQLTGDVPLRAFRETSPVSPTEIVETALDHKCPSVSYTYTEPTVFLEYALDTMKLAKEHGLKNIWVSNGFFSKETFDSILPYLQAANIDLKSFDDDFYQRYCGGRLAPALDNLKRLKQNKIHLEITTLVIPTLNDSPALFEKTAAFIVKELGPETPWHISGFSPQISWKLKGLSPTPLSTLKDIQEIGRRGGLKNIHLGNI